MKPILPKRAGRLAVGIVCVFFVGCVLIPLSTVFAMLSWAKLTDPSILAIARITFGQATWSAAISAAIGLGLGLWRPLWNSRLAHGLLGLPYGVPTVVAATAWSVWLGRSGLDWNYTFKAVILANVFFNAPWITLMVARARAEVNEAEIEAAASLGAGAAATFRFVLWPAVRWAWAAAFCQALSVCAMSFALVLILGGGPPVETLEVALYSHLRMGSLDRGAAAACAFWEILITTVPWGLMIAFERAETGTPRTTRREAFRVGTRRLSQGFAILIGLAFVVPYLAVLRGLGNPNWPDLIFPFFQSLELALFSATGALMLAIAGITALSYLAARSGPGRFVLGVFLGLPSGLSVLALGLGFWRAYADWIDPFAGSLFAIVALQATTLLPVAFRILWPVARRSERRLLEAALVHGASPWRAFLAVEWPRLRGPIRSAFGIAAGLAVGEVAAVSLFYSENLMPLPLLVSRWMTQYRFEDARAVSAMLLVLAMGFIFSGNLGAKARHS